MPEHISIYFYRNYLVEMTRMDVPIADPEWLIIKKTKITKYNRTTSVFQGTGILLGDFPDTLNVSISYSFTLYNSIPLCMYIL
jgi:hypothetical protein